MRAAFAVLERVRDHVRHWTTQHLLLRHSLLAADAGVVPFHQLRPKQRLCLLTVELRAPNIWAIKRCSISSSFCADFKSITALSVDLQHASPSWWEAHRRRAPRLELRQAPCPFGPGLLRRHLQRHIIYMPRLALLPTRGSSSSTAEQFTPTQPGGRGRGRMPQPAQNSKLVNTTFSVTTPLFYRTQKW